MTFRIDEGRPTPDELLTLYREVGWTAYTEAPETLVAAVAASHTVVLARAADGRLVGLARTLSDDHTIAYLQDVLVHPDVRREGVGGALLDAVLERYRHVRQLVLLTDAEPGQRLFYESRGLREVRDVDPPLRSFVRI
ncbi:GNAT family N-acetyltransferase [Litorihabitans aurantiacus]|uniref:N-acetyltransferase n=1 Tax=Litorihabitans aurantiacus TaxID=1930061 RepID=A0AA37UMI8_9MICO|nr:GNAT family N-acetyltransferase [Litorihabitans aurantiacus]GMA31285.1 N-acetyltransferase [Litorihabitans aurantiacus]